MKNDAELADLAYRIRQHCVRMIHSGKASHIGSSLSAVELLTVLYGKILNISPSRLDDPERDRFILSKGHGCAAMYAALAETGFFPLKWLDTFYQNGSLLPGHVTHKTVPGIEVSTGALGHGLSIACGMAVAGKYDKRPYRVFTLLSDGECDEGSTWEAMMFAAHHKLDNLIAIVDYNKIQAMGRVDEILSLEPFANKLEAFGWTVVEINGHNIDEIENVLKKVPFKNGKPSVIIAHTVKGKGVSFMENDVLWHYRCPSDEEFTRALRELEAGI